MTDYVNFLFNIYTEFLLCAASFAESTPPAERQGHCACSVSAHLVASLPLEPDLGPSNPKGPMLMIVSHNPVKTVKFIHITQNRHRHMDLLEITELRRRSRQNGRADNADNTVSGHSR